MLAFLADKPRYPSLPEGMAMQVQWVALAALALVVLWAWTRGESTRRGLSGLVDPRVYAVLRVGFAALTLVCFLNLHPYWRMLWSDEGLFTLDYARERLGRSALRGWTPDEGFLDGWAVLNFLWSKPSLLFIHGSPAFVHAYMAVFFAVLVAFGLGIFSRVTGVLAWLLMNGVYVRNQLYWEGTDLVFRAFWFILIFARTGHAWSVDNWWRCRRLRRAGRLHEGDGPEPAGKEPVYRLAPNWPRLLFMVQLALLYTTTGLVKTGGIWKKGDALYYALNMDHFYRFEWVTQLVSYYLGTTVFRWMTHVTLWWERGFPLILLGMAWKFFLDHRDAPWARAERAVRVRIWAGRLALAGALLAIYWVAWTAYPYSVKTPGGEPAVHTPGRRLIPVLLLGVVPAFVGVSALLGRRPIVLPRVVLPLGRLRPGLGPVRIDPPFLRRWLLGRRLWLGLGAVFHGFLILFMNIGVFPMIMLMTYAAFIEGEVWARGLGGAARLLARIVPAPAGRWLKARAPGWTRPAQAAAAVRPLGGRIPDPVVLLFLAAGGALLALRGELPRPPWLATAGWGWLGALASVAALMLLRKPSPRDLPGCVGAGPATARTALGRTFAVLALAWHASALALHLAPSLPALARLRTTLRIHGPWLSVTQTSQSWNMFAPNPPTANTFMVTVVVEPDGDRWDLRNNAWKTRPNPFIVNDRMRKMQRRMLHKGKWYLEHWAAFQCREWTLRTGQMPRKIIIDKVVSRIPGPELVRKKGPYHPRKLRFTRKTVKTVPCEPKGRLPLYMKARYGLAITDEDRARAAKQAERDARTWEGRKTAWRRRRDWGGGPDAPRPDASGRPDAAKPSGGGSGAPARPRLPVRPLGAAKPPAPPPEGAVAPADPTPREAAAEAEERAALRPAGGDGG